MSDDAKLLLLVATYHSSARRQIDGNSSVRLWAFSGGGQSFWARGHAGLSKRCAASEFRYYGGRGVTVHATWIDDYSAFRAWAHANGYRDGLSIKRIDVNGDYEPKNCTWIPQRDQSRIDAKGG